MPDALMMNAKATKGEIFEHSDVTYFLVLLLQAFLLAALQWQLCSLELALIVQSR